MIVTLLVFLLILSVLVIIHEAGHYFAAKRLGIKVEEFGFGLPLTKAWFSVKRGETVYSFYPALIGGFVKLYGEDEAGSGRVAVKHEEVHDKDIHRAFYARSVTQRASVVLAGVIMNALLAVAIYYVFLGLSNFKTELPLIGDHHFFAVNEQVKTEIIISDVVKDSPAEKAGIKPFSRLIAINGNSVKNTEDFVTYIKAQEGKVVTLEWENTKSGKKFTANVKPRVNPPKGQGALGIAFYPVKTAILIYDTPAQKIFSGFTHPANLMAYNFDLLGNLIGISLKEKTVEPLKPAVSGPVGIGFVVGTIVSISDFRDRIMQLLNLSGLLSISLAFFNVLPIPGLDGGRLFFILIEGIFKKKVNPRIEGYIHAGGMALLLLLVFFVTINDLQMHKDSIISFFRDNFFQKFINP